MRTDHALLRAATSDLMTVAIGALAGWLQDSDEGPVAPIADTEEERAAALLGIDVDASADEIRAALRARIVEDNLHPDQGGDGEQATELIAAQNLLLARARAQRGRGSHA